MVACSFHVLTGHESILVLADSVSLEHLDDIAGGLFSKSFSLFPQRFKVNRDGLVTLRVQISHGMEDVLPLVGCVFFVS